MEVSVGEGRAARSAARHRDVVDACARSGAKDRDAILPPHKNDKSLTNTRVLAGRFATLNAVPIERFALYANDMSGSPSFHFPSVPKLTVC